jgi:hypothetical protein
MTICLYCFSRDAQLQATKPLTFFKFPSATSHAGLDGRSGSTVYFFMFVHGAEKRGGEEGD